MNYTNRANIPEVFVEAITKRSKQYSKGDADYSVSDLLISPREYWLKKIHEDKLSVDVSDLIAAWEGHLIHDAVEKGVKRAIMEFDIDGTFVKLSGAADCVTEDTIVDYKTTSVWTIIHGSNIDKWTQQINCYSYLYRHPTLLGKIIILSQK
jgi:hypothetical protein